MPYGAYQWVPTTSTTLKGIQMYNILITLMATALIVFGSEGLDGGMLFKFALVVGGLYLGHVVTEALNANKSDGV